MRAWETANARSETEENVRECTQGVRCDCRGRRGGAGSSLLAPGVRAARRPSGQPVPDRGRPSPAASPAAAQAAPARPKPRLRHLRLRDARHGLPDGQNDPNWFDVLRPTKLPAFENEFGEDGHFFAGVRQTRFGVKGFTPTDVGRAQDHVRVRAVRRRRRRGPDDVPPAPRLRRARPVRRRPDLEPVHGHRRVPELDRVLGAERDGVLPQRPAALDADPGRRLARSRSRSSGRAPAPTRATTPAASSSQDVRARFPLPDLSAEYRHGGRLGLRRARRHPARRSSGTT